MEVIKIEEPIPLPKLILISNLSTGIIPISGLQAEVKSGMVVLLAPS